MFTVEYEPKIASNMIAASFGIRNEAGQVLFVEMNGHHDGPSLRGSYELELTAIGGEPVGFATSDTFSFTADDSQIKFRSALDEPSLLMKPTLPQLSKIALAKVLSCQVSGGSFTVTHAQKAVIAKFAGYFLGVK
jgi:hypothetical protein